MFILLVLRGTTFNVRHYTQTVHPIVFIPAMLIGTIDFYHFRSLSLTLTLSGGHKVSTMQNLLFFGFCFFFFFSHNFHLIIMNFDVVMKQFKLNTLRLHLSKIHFNKGNNCCFNDCVKSLYR